MELEREMRTALALAWALLPALGFVLVVEGFFIRWRQRTAPATPEEAKLRNNQRLALRHSRKR